MILLVVLMVSCDIFDSDLNENSMMTFTAICETDSGYVGRIVLTDYYDLNSYKLITQPGERAEISVFSKTKEKILIGFNRGMTHNYEFAIYDIETDSLEELYIEMEDYRIPLYGVNPVWDYDDKGFYFSNAPWGGIDYYDLITNEKTVINSGVNLLGLKSPDSLIIFSGGYYNDTGDSNCLFIMPKTGNDLKQIINPYLEYINRNGIMKKSAMFTNWNEETQQFLYLALDSTQAAHRIAITNYSGTFQKEFTNSYYDESPVWGPNNTIIFFDRVNTMYEQEGMHVLNTTTGRVRSFIDMINVEDAVLLYNASY